LEQWEQWRHTSGADIFTSPAMGSVVHGAQGAGVGRRGSAGAVVANFFDVVLFPQLAS